MKEVWKIDLLASGNRHVTICQGTICQAVEDVYKRFQNITDMDATLVSKVESEDENGSK